MMDLFGGLFGYPFGFSGNGMDARALSDAEIMQIQWANGARMQNANQGLANVLGAVNAFRPAEKPLGERFIDFKARLAAAIHRMEQAKLTGTANQVHMGTIK